MVVVTICSDFGAQENNLSLFPLFPHLFAIEMMGLEAIVLVFWMLSFKPTFSLSSFTFIKRLFSSSSLSSVKAVSSLYLRLLIFLLAILIPACTSSCLTFLMMYSAFKLNKQGDNIQPWHTPFPIWNQFIVPCPVLTAASWLAHRFLRRQVRGSGIPIFLRIFHSLFLVKGLASQMEMPYSKSPTYKPSCCKLSNMQICTPCTIMHLVYTVMCRDPLWVAVPLCTLLHSTYRVQ